MKSSFNGQPFTLKVVLILTLCFSSCTPRRYPTGSVAVQVQPTPQLLQRGKALVGMICADCHRNPVTGALSGKRLTDVPKMLGTLYSANITQHPELGIGTYTDSQLAYLLRTGIDRHGRMQPLMQKPGLSESDLQAMIAFLKSSDDPMVKPAAVQPPVSRYSLPARIAMPLLAKPLPYPAHPVQPGTDEVAQGRYLVNVLGCYECHSKDILKIDRLEPEKSKGYLGGGNKLLNLDGKTVRTPNLTPDPETGLGKWSRKDLVDALRTGFRPDHSVMRYPMPTYTELSEAEAGAIYAYLQTVPPIRNRVKKTDPARVPASESADTLAAGGQLYAQYGCRSCHGETGLGIADLRMAARNYPDDGRLKARIENPAAFSPASRMPRFAGVIPEKDFPPLLAYVRWLGKSNAAE